MLHLGIFILYLCQASKHYRGPADVVTRVLNVIVASVPTGLATVLIFSLVSQDLDFNTSQLVATVRAMSMMLSQSALHCAACDVAV